MRPCPCCKATGNDSSTCRRCKADLTPIARMDEQRAQLFDSIRIYLGQGQLTQAEALLNKAERLDTDQASRQLRAMLYLLQRDHHQAWSMVEGRGMNNE